MAKNQRYTHGHHIALTAPVALVSGQPARIGQFVGVVQVSAEADEKVTLWLDGSYEVPVTGAVTEGQAVFIKADNTLTATATGNYPFGVAVVSKGTGTAPVEVAPFGKITATAAQA